MENGCKDISFQQAKKNLLFLAGFLLAWNRLVVGEKFRLALDCLDDACYPCFKAGLLLFGKTLEGTSNVFRNQTLIRRSISFQCICADRRNPSGQFIGKTLRLSKRKNVSLEQRSELLRDVRAKAGSLRSRSEVQGTYLLERVPSSRTNSEKRAFVFSAHCVEDELNLRTKRKRWLMVPPFSFFLRLPPRLP
jgi:hypothetical protein